MSRRRVMNWRYFEIVLVAVLLSILALTPAAGPVAQAAARRCDDAYCYETICTPAPNSCRYVANRVCKPTTKEECTTQNVRTCHRVPHTVCSTPTANSCRPHLKRVCGDTSRYRTYAAEQLSHYRKVPHLRPRRVVAPRTPRLPAPRTPRLPAPRTPRLPVPHTPQLSPHQTCHLQIVRECGNASKQVCHQAYKEECSNLPERSCHHRETQDCHDEPKYVCEKGQDRCYEQRVARAPAPDPPSHPDGAGRYEKVPPAPHKEAKAEEPYKKATPPPPEDTKPSEPSRPVKSPPSTSPEWTGTGQPAPRTAESTRWVWPRELLIDTRVVMVPLVAGLAAFGMFLLLASRRRKSQANDRSPRRASQEKDHSRPRDVDIAYRGKPDPGTQDVSRLAVPPVGPRITLRTVAGQRQVNITLG